MTPSGGPTTSGWPAQLQQALAKHFNLEELQDLCLRLGIDFEELAGEGKSARVLSLLRHVVPNGQLDALLDEAQALRPRVATWAAVRQEAAAHPELFDQVVAAVEVAKTVNLTGDFRGAIFNIESTFVGPAAAKDLEGQAPAPGEAPYKGLQSFDESDADHFLGREALTAQVVGRLAQTRFLAVIGASGSGKSSLVRAGVIPALRRGRPLADGSLPPSGSPSWDIVVLTPTAHPIDALAAALTRDGSPAEASALAGQFAQDPAALGFAARQSLARTGKSHLLLVIDQFEEVFSLCRSGEERRAFFDALVRATGDGAGSPLTVLIALRADFYARFSEHDGLRELVSRNQEYIGAMTRDELFRAIVEPAARADWKIEKGLVDLMLDDAGDEPGALPLLSHALLETWSRRRGRTMTLSGYKESGGVRGAIAKTAETVFQKQLTPDQRPIARSIFVRLTELGEGESAGDVPDTRRRAQFSELITRATDPTMLDAVLDILVDARLVTTNVLPPGDTQVIEVAHEALIREWPTLRSWLEQDREGLIRHRQLTEDVNDWLKLDRDPGALYRGARLEQALAWTADAPDPLSVDELAFLDASRAEVAREQRGRALQRVLAVASVLLLVAAVFAALVALEVIELNPTPDTMSGDFNIAVAEFAVLDEAGNLTNDTHDGGLRIAERIGRTLQQEFADRPGVEVWYDSRELEREHNVTIGVVDPALGVTGPDEASTPQDAAEALEADLVIHGQVVPEGEQGRTTLRFFLTPQFGADFGSMVGRHEFTARIPVFDETDPSEEVWRELDPLAGAIAWLVVGLRQEILGESADAVSSLQQAVAFAPDSDVIQYFLGQEHFYTAQRGRDTLPAEELAGHLAAADAAFAEALRLNPDNARARIGQGSVHFARGQNLMRLLRTGALAGEPAQALESIGLEAQAAFEAYGEVARAAAEADLTAQYGVPIGAIAGQGQSIAQRLLAEVRFEQGDLPAAEALVAEAIDRLQSAVDQVDTDNDPRIAAQTYQALGTLYEYQSTFLEVTGDAEGAQQARSDALDWYRECEERGQSYAIDTYLVERIVGQLCRPRIEALEAAGGGG
jgi:tetratricopeptide (TPR) repeat protein